MARTTKKKQAVPAVDIGAEIFASLRELEKIKGIDRTEIPHSAFFILYSATIL